MTALAAAGSALVTACRDRDGSGTWLRGFHARTRRSTWAQKAPAQKVSMSLSADGGSLLVTTAAGTNHVYRLVAGKPQAYRKWKRKRGSGKGRSQGLSADGSMLIRGDVRGQVRGYFLQSYKMMWLVRAERVVVSRDGRAAAVVQGKQVQVLDATSGRPLGRTWRLAGDLLALAGHSGGRWAQVLRRGGACELRVTGRAPVAVTCLRNPQLAWSPGGSLLALAGQGSATLFQADKPRAITSHRSRFWAPLRVAFISDTSFALANEVGGQVSFYRLVRRGVQGGGVGSAQQRNPA